ncbi:hypothetical protein D9M72_340130 [compost metagenome]
MIALLRALDLKSASCLWTYSGCWAASLGLAAAALLPAAPWQLRQAGTLRSGAPWVYSVSPLAGSAFAAACSAADASPERAAAGTASARTPRIFAMRFIRTPSLNCFGYRDACRPGALPAVRTRRCKGWYRGDPRAADRSAKRWPWRQTPPARSRRRRTLRCNAQCGARPCPRWNDTLGSPPGRRQPRHAAMDATRHPFRRPLTGVLYNKLCAGLMPCALSCPFRAAPDQPRRAAQAASHPTLARPRPRHAQCAQPPRPAPPL